MSRKQLYRASSIVLWVFALSAFFRPTQFFADGVTVDTPGVLVTRLLAGVLGGIAMLGYAYKDLDDSKPVQLFTGVMFLEWGFLALLVLMGQLSGVFNAKGWLLVAFCVLFSIGFGQRVLSDRRHSIPDSS